MARYLFGRIAWVPMMITREERKIPDPETGKMQTHWPVRLYPTATVSEVNQIRSDTNRIIHRQEQFALPEPVIEGEFTSEPSGNDEKQEDPPTGDPASGVDEFIAMIEGAMSQQEIDKLFKSNNEGINKLPNKDKAKIIDAKHKREYELKEIEKFAAA